MSELISIIIPIYEVEEYLEKCIESIVSQTYENLEIILVDDGSPDRCPQICDEWEKRDERIKVIHKKNGGLSDARNTGLAVAKGEYIGFVDSDDYIDKEMYEKLYIAMKSENADLAICNLEKVREDGSSIEEESPIKNDVFTGAVGLEKICDPCISGWYYVTVWNKLYHRKILDGIEFPLGKIHEDEFVIHEILYQCERIVTLEEKLYKYVQRNGSIMSHEYGIKNLDAVEAVCKRVLFYKKNEITENYSNISARLKYLYNIRRLNITMAPSRNEKKRVREIDKMFKACYFACAENITWREKIMYSFPDLWVFNYKLKIGKIDRINRRKKN